MIDAIPEQALGPPDATAEHVAANIGMTALLGGSMGADYKPKEGPFHSITKEVGKEPDMAPIKVFEELTKMKKDALSNIEKGSSSLFSGEAPPAEEETIGKSLHGLHDISNGLSVSPDVLINHIANQTAPIADHAPEIAANLSQIAGGALGVLHDHKPNLTPSSPLDMEKVPNRDEVSKFNRTANLLDKPLSIFSKIKDGTVLSSDINLLQTIYPNTLASIKDSVMKGLIDYRAKDKPPLDYSMRLGLSRLLGQNMDSSLNFLAQNQAALSGMGVANQQQQMQPPSGNKTGIGKMKPGTREQTRAQQSVERKPA